MDSAVWTLVMVALAFVGPGRGDYAQIVDLGLNCTPKDTCGQKWSRSRQLQNEEERSCACDQMCTRYDDCCIDGPSVPNPSPPKLFSCVKLRNYDGVFMVTTCPGGWAGDAEVRLRCEGHYNKSDPVANLPVTDTSSSVTYRNINCATCHQVSLSKLVMWQLRLEFPDNNNNDSGNVSYSQLVMSDLAFQNSDGRWGFNQTKNDGELYFLEASVDPSLPVELHDRIRICKPDLKSDCPANWTDQEVSKKCLSFQGAQYTKDRGGGGGKAYRNAFCAICNGEDLSQLTCKKPDQRSLIDFRSFSAMAFAVLVDISDKHDAGVGLKVVCPERQIYDVLFKKCRSLTCSGGDQLLEGDLCVSARFNSCAQVILPEGEFLLLPNNSLSVPTYDRLYDPGHFRLRNKSAFVCAPEGSSRLARKFSPAMGYVTVACLSASVFCLLLHLLFFFLVPSERNLSSKNLTSLTVSLLLAYLGFLVAQWHPLPKILCTFLSVEMFFFYLSAFFWMNVMAFDVWRTLRMATRELRVNSGRQCCRYLLYSLYGWCVPAGIVCAALVLEFTTDDGQSTFRPRFGRQWCWFGSRDALLVFFAIPLAVMMAANVAFFTSSAWMIASTTKATVKHTGSNRKNFRLYWKLALMLGLSWSFAFLASYLNLETLWYLFVVLNCLKGLFIFFAFTCNGKVKRFLAEKVSCLTKRRAYRTSSESACNSNSTQPSVNPAFKTSSTDLRSKSVSSL